jgi:alpha-beta hydrolase superfamily lysophospholipase
MTLSPSQIDVRQRMMTMPDGAQLHVSDHLLAGSRHCIVIMHGIGEHSGRYPHVIRFFNECGMSVRVYDHRGHGKSQGARGDVPASDTIFNDAKVVVADFAAQQGMVPLLFGHSMGGLFALRFTLAKLVPLQALLLSSPPLVLPLNVGQKMLLAVLKTVAPGFAIPNGLPLEGLSRDPAVAVAYKNDPLVHNKVTARLLLCMLDGIAYCQQHATELDIPTLVVVAGTDSLVDCTGSRAYFPRFSPQLVTMHWYQEGFHELHNDIIQEQVFADERAWLQARGFIS